MPKPHSTIQGKETKVFPFPTKWNNAEYRYILERISMKGRILDIGCGRGETLYFFQECYGIDIRRYETWNDKPIQKRKFADREYGLFLRGVTLGYKRKTLNCVVSDGCYLPFREDIFNGVLLNSSFYYFRDRDSLVREIYRVTKNRGEIVLILPSVKWKFYKLFELPKNLIRFFRGYPVVKDWLVHAKGVYKNNFLKEFYEFSNWRRILSEYFDVSQVEKVRGGLNTIYWCHKISDYQKNSIYAGL